MRGLGSVAAARLEGTGETRPGTDLLRSALEPGPGSQPLDSRRRDRTAGLRERARQLRRQVLVPLVMLAAAESAELSSSSRRVYRELSHARSGTRVLVG